MMTAITVWIQAHLATVFGVLFGLSETLAIFPGLKSNSVFQFVVNILKWFKENVFKQDLPKL